jgi:hypothetical protein
MSVNDSSRIIIGDSRVTIRVVASLSDDSRGVIYDRNVYSTGQRVWIGKTFHKHF